MRDLETELESTDEPTRQILQQSVELWLGDSKVHALEDDVNKPLKSLNAKANPEWEP